MSSSNTSTSTKTLPLPPSYCYQLSPQGLQQMLQRPIDQKYPGRHVVWTDDFKKQMPIRKQKDGVGAERGVTLIQQFRNTIAKHSNKPALSFKHNNKWYTYTYGQYYDNAIAFAKALISFTPQYSSVNIIGFNSPQWAFAFYGTLFSRCIATGIYTTNNIDVCQYIARNSQCAVVVCQTVQYAKNYISMIRNKQIKCCIVYGIGENLDALMGEGYLNGKSRQQMGILTWQQFIDKGVNVPIFAVQQRMNSVKPGNCATLVYTSGTTGMPKGVMLSHDNFTWTKKAMDAYHKRQPMQNVRIISYLPLSHVAGIFADLISSMIQGYHVYFAQPDALQGSLIETMKEVKPVIFLSVPRVWEKIQEKMKQVAKQNGWLKTQIANWAKSIGPLGTVQQARKQQTSLQFQIAKKLIFSKVKQQLGLDECKYFLYGAAPLDPQIRYYFLSLNIFLVNTYGMSESTGPQNFTNIDNFNFKNIKSLREAGSSVPGTQMIIVKENPKDDDGQICYRGRNIFMGYYKNPQQTQRVFDQQGFLHSGDLGKLTKDNTLFITGRAKQLIITAGGENIPPVLIQNQIKSALPCVSNVMVVGDNRKYLTCLITLKQDPPFSGKLQQNCKDFLKSNGCPISSIPQAKQSRQLKRILDDGIRAANNKAISRAQHVHNFYLLDKDFGVDSGQLTPTLKLKRREVIRKYQREIQEMYSNTNAKL